MRGLKPVAHFKDILKVQVASFTDAWIETVTENTLLTLPGSHLLQMRGLKL